jgi:hypothetical protein
VTGTQQTDYYQFVFHYHSKIYKMTALNDIKIKQNGKHTRAPNALFTAF